MGTLILLLLLAEPTLAAAPSAPRSDWRLREGSVLTDEHGTFRLTGDRVTFYPAGNTARPLRALENLALERVARIVGETTETREWIVSGIITEFRGTNYLLLHRAIQASSPKK